MEALLAWALRPAPLPSPPTGPAPPPRRGAVPDPEVLLIVVSVPGGDTTLTRMTRAEADAAVRAESPAILGSVTTAEGRTIYVRDALRDALAEWAPDGPIAVIPGRRRGDALLDMDA